MNREDIIRMARKAGLTVCRDEWVFGEMLERFAALVSAAEREAIAQSLDKQADLTGDPMDRKWAREMAAAVRARSNT